MSLGILMLLVMSAWADRPLFTKADAKKLATAMSSSLESCPGYAESHELTIMSVANRTDEHIDKTWVREALGKALSKGSKHAVNFAEAGASPRGLFMDLVLVGENSQNGDTYRATYTLELSLKDGEKPLCSKKVSITNTANNPKSSK